jgi:hypothetical protein
MNQLILAQENTAYGAGGGVSANNRCLGFQPAFRNSETGCIYPSRFADGRPAPIHMIDGLPDEVVVARSATGKVTSVKSSVQSGFTMNGIFYDRDEAARYSRALDQPGNAITTTDSSTSARPLWRTRRPLPESAKPTMRPPVGNSSVISSLCGPRSTAATLPCS